MKSSETYPSGTDTPRASELPPQVAALGERISRTLLRGREDPTAVWIGMRIAELMQRAEDAPTAEVRAEAARDCQELVLAAWRHRRSWPRGWPPSTVAPLSAALEQLVSPIPPSRQAREASSSLGWSERLLEALRDFDRERRLWTLLALHELDVDELDAWRELALVVGSSGSPSDEGSTLIAAVHEPEHDAVGEVSEDEVLRILSDLSRDADAALQQLLAPPRTLNANVAERGRAELTAAAVKELRRILKRRLELTKGVIS